MYSLALSKGCNAGSRFRGCRETVEPGVCAEAAERLRALIFCIRSQFIACKSLGIAHHPVIAIGLFFTLFCISFGATGYRRGMVTLKLSYSSRDVVRF